MHGKSIAAAHPFAKWLARTNRMKEREDCIRPYRSTMVLLALLLVLSCCSLFVGVINLTPAELLAGNFEQIEIS